MLNGNYRVVTAGVNLDTLRTTCTQFNPNCDLTTAPRIAVSESIPFQPWDISARDRWLILPQLTLIGGVRQSHDNYLNKTYTEPRLGAEWAWSERTLLNAGWGKHNQMPGTQEILRNYGNPNLSHILAEHRVLGITRTLEEGWTWKTEAYYKKISDLVVNDPSSIYVNGGSGRAYGVEILIKKAQVDRLSGWLSLTLAKSERRNDLTGETFNFGYDQPINATVVGTYKLMNNWTLGAKWTFHTGNPYTPIVGTNGTYTDGRPVPLYGAINSERFPNYHRLDLRLDRTYVYNTWKLTNFFEIINAYANKNVGGYDYGPYYDRKTPIYQLPLLPTFGVEAEF
jgi:outer membrane receptor for ferrienterochelin and colicin